MDKALKQRMVGASVLIALAVIVLPMLLGGRQESDTQQTKKIELPAQPPELSFETRRYPIGEQAPLKQAEQGGAGEDKPVSQLPAPSSPATPLEKPAAAGPAIVKPEINEQTAAALTKAEPVPDGKTPDSGRYIVQVASFGAIDNANKLSASLRSHGYSVMTDSVTSDVGTLHRVRVGPFDTETEANKTTLDLASKISDIKPRIMDLQPGKSTQITTPSDPLIRWIVQVGSFSSAANSEKLVATLRLDGLSAYEETVSSPGSTIYRVRIGPFLQREEAIAIELRVREKMSLDGVVMSVE